MFAPQLRATLKHYTRRQFLADLQAGIIVGIVAIPLAIAFAIASGVTPERGLYTAIVAGFIISALGGSKVQIGGPTGAFVVIVYAIVQKYGVGGLSVATLMAGVLLVMLGLARLGTAIKFIPHPVVQGFTSGIAIIIFSSQVKDLLGLRMGAVPSEFFHKWIAFAQHIGSINWYAIGLAALTLVIITQWPRVSRAVPGPFVALLVATVVAQVFHFPVETIGSRFGGLSASLPHPVVPHLSFEQIAGLVQPAVAIALLAAIESLLSAVVADGMIGDRHRSNAELIAQGVANIASPIFGGIPATGAIARTATNIKNGGRTPIAGMVHALTVLLITVSLGALAARIPLAVLAGILTVVSYHMSEWRGFVDELRGPKSDVAVLIATFVLTVAVDLTVAIEVGMVLAALLFMRRMAEVTNVSAVTHEEIADEVAVTTTNMRALRAGVDIYEIDGPFFFGAAESFRETIGQVSKTPDTLILRMRHVPVIDATGIHALTQIASRLRHSGTRVIITELRGQALRAVENAAVAERTGVTLTEDVDAALACVSAENAV